MKTTAPDHVMVDEKYDTKFYEATDSARNFHNMGCRFGHMEWPKWAWPGGYPIYYVTADWGILCADCANENMHLTLDGDSQWRIECIEVNYEDNELWCDNCNCQIESAYGED